MSKITVEPIEIDVDKKMIAVKQLIGDELININNQSDMAFWRDRLIKIKAKILDFIEERKTITKPLDIAKKNTMDLFRTPIEWLENKEKAIKLGLSEYIEKEQKRLQQIQDKLDETARKEELKKKQALEERAKKAETNGNLEKAEELREKIEEVQVMAPVINTEMRGKPPTRENWTGIVENFALLPDPYKTINQSAINKTAQATKGKQSIPGVVFKCETIIIGK